MDLNEVPATAFRRHPWEVARARFFGRLIAGATATGRPARVLDIGAGDGYLGRALLDMIPAGSTVACVDPHYTDRDLERFAAMSGAMSASASPPAPTPAPIPALSFSRARPAGPFDVVLMLDVIEHVADDRAFVTDTLAGTLAAGASVVISVPAWDLLYGQHDRALKHFRRYRPAQCRALLRSVGLQIVRQGGLFHSLLFPRIVQRLAESVRGARGMEGEGHPANLGEWHGGPALSSAVTMALALDTRLSEGLADLGGALPGLSYWALCRRETT
jgi:2-polyprenyl-3-methyl-5-hydroxy-6-metoxy-1,4-benzoquinol methylase